MIHEDARSQRSTTRSAGEFVPRFPATEFRVVSGDGGGVG